MKFPGTKTHHLTAALLVGLITAPAVLANLPEGVPVRSIEGADAISGWSQIDGQRVLLNLDEKNTYLLTLKYQCHGLAWAQNVTVTMSNNTIWAGFDEIQADGLACPIHSIQKIDSKDL